ncbi:MAG: shikimate kinase [Chitinophagaceae bacterium]|nr:shikimate kinase [Chitinophagaceae bacterium]
MNTKTDLSSPIGGQGANLGCIFLIGFMGCGKTYWGKKWADHSGLTFVDLDEIVEAQQDRTAAQIFAEDGEDHFRDLETAALKSFSGNNIIATGGGTPCYNDNINWMNNHGTAIYLLSSPQNIFSRLVNETKKRPLIQHLQGEELLFYITEKIKEREFFYRQAGLILNVDDFAEDYIPAIIK